MTSPSPLHYTNVYNTSNFALLSYIRLGGGTVSRYSINFPVTPTSYSQRLRFIFIESNLRHLCAHADCLLPSYLLIPRSTVLLEKLTGCQLVKKFPAFYGTRVHYRRHKCPSTVPIRSQFDSVRIPTSHFLMIHLLLPTVRDEYGPYQGD